jgi:hypothetical protein
MPPQMHPPVSFAARSAWWLVLLSTSSTLLAQLPVARVSYLAPAGGRAGTTFELTVAGSDLDEPARIYFSHPGITATPKPDENKFDVTIASNVPPRNYEARFVGRYGISNPRVFVVGNFRESQVPPTNLTAGSAVELKLDSTANSSARANSVAWFKFNAKKSQRLFIECLAETLDSRLDPVLLLTDISGRELERARIGGFIDFTAPHDGSYSLEVSDFLYRGGDDYFYRLTLKTGPHVDFILPPAGVPGTKNNHVLYGRNLPGGKPVKGQTLDGKPLEQLTVEIAIPDDERARSLNTGSLVRPSDAVVDGFDYRLRTAKGTANPVFVAFATATVVLEQEPNNHPGQSQSITPPCEVAGQFYPANELDWFTFPAKKGEVFWIEVFSQRHGLPTDPFLLIHRVAKNDKGEEQLSDVQEVYDNDTNIGGGEFNTATRDPLTRFEAKETGTYRVMVRDLFQRAERSPRFVYRLSIRKERPDFRLVAQTLAPKPNAADKKIDIGVPLLRRGETLPVRVMAFRRDGFNGDIELALENPPPGLIFAGDRIPAGQNSDVILVTAAEEAPAFAGPIKLIGKAKVGEQEVVREARSGTMVFSVGNTDSERPDARLARDLTLAISDKERAPISIAAVENKNWEVPANAKLQIPLKITRRGDFNATLKLKPLGPGTPEALKEFDADSKATNVTLTLDFASLKLAPGLHAFALQTQTTGKYRNNPEAADFAEARAREASKTADELAAAATKAAEESELSTKTFTTVESSAKAAAEKLALAKAALEKTPEDEKLTAGLASAEREVADEDVKMKTAAEAKAAAEKAKSAAQEKAKEAQARKEATAARAKQAVEKAKPKDVSVIVYSPPIKVRVTPVEEAKNK